MRCLSLINFTNSRLRLTLQEPNSFFFACCGDKDILISDLEPLIFQHFFGRRDPFAWILIVQFQNRPSCRFQFQLLSCQFNDALIWRDGSLAKITKHHLSIRLRNLLPGPEHDVVKCLLKIELRDRRHGRPKSTFANHITHRHDDFGILIHDIVITQHLRIRRQGSTGHRAPRDQWFHGRCFRGKEVIAHAILENFFRLTDFFHINIKFEITPP